MTTPRGQWDHTTYSDKFIEFINRIYTMSGPWTRNHAQIIPRSVTTAKLTEDATEAAAAAPRHPHHGDGVIGLDDTVEDQELVDARVYGSSF
jgi:hypothetical protein